MVAFNKPVQLRAENNDVARRVKKFASAHTSVDTMVRRDRLSFATVKAIEIAVEILLELLRGHFGNVQVTGLKSTIGKENRVQAPGKVLSA